MNTSSLIQKVWNFCHTLRDDGVGYGDYLEQLTYLLFLKMAHEYAQEPYNRDTHIPAGYDWAALRSKTGEPLEAHYPPGRTKSADTENCAHTKCATTARQKMLRQCTWL